MGLACWVLHVKCWYLKQFGFLYHLVFTVRYDHSFILTGRNALKNATIIFFAIDTLNLWLRCFKYLSTYLAEPVCFCFANGSSSGCFKHGAEADAPPKTLLYPKVWNGRCFWHTDMYLFYYELLNGHSTIIYMYSNYLVLTYLSNGNHFTKI